MLSTNNTHSKLYTTVFPFFKKKSQTYIAGLNNNIVLYQTVFLYVEWKR